MVGGAVDHLGFDHQFRRHPANPFSLSVAPNGRTLRISAKALGEGSARLAYLRPGTWAIFEGPYGRLCSRARTQRKVLLAGAGVGITPLRALAEGTGVRAQ
jgi:predicted ferric reductase